MPPVGAPPNLDEPGSPHNPLRPGPRYTGLVPDFSNRTIWITGASSGLGEALAYAFAATGATLILTARRSDELERVKQACASPERVHLVPADLLDEAARAEAVTAAEAAAGRVDVLVNNAGLSQRSLAHETSMHVVRRIMELNFFAVVDLSQRVLPGMLRRGDGHLVNISSVAGYVATPKRSAYAASKHALHGFFDAVRAEVSAQGVAVTNVCPGYVRTAISKNALTAEGLPQGKVETAVDNGMDPGVCAKKIVAAVARKDRELLVGGKETYAVYLQRLLPGLVARIAPRAAPKA